MVFAPASQGDLGIAPRHAPLLTLLKAGEVRVQTPGRRRAGVLRGRRRAGDPAHKVTVLADTALRAKDIDEAAALAAKQRAEEALKDRAATSTRPKRWPNWRVWPRSSKSSSGCAKYGADREAIAIQQPALRAAPESAERVRAARPAASVARPLRSQFRPARRAPLLNLLVWAALDTLHAETGSQLRLDGLYGWSFYLLIALFACGLVARAYCRQADTRSLLIPTLAVSPYVLILPSGC